MLDFLSSITAQEEKSLQTRVPKLAEDIQNLANQKITWTERLQAEEFARMVKDPYSRAVFMVLTDQVFRLSQDASILQKFVHILKQHGVPAFFGTLDQAILKLLTLFGPLIPNIFSPPIVWTILKVMRYKTRKVILNGEPKDLQKYFLNCKKENLKINLNHLGDMVLGEKEATKHLKDYIKGLRDPNVSCVSVKISTLYSQTDSIAYEHTVSTVAERLESLLKTALLEEKNSNTPKLVYLDMEEYRDLSLTVDVFKRILENKELNKISLGIALQAYIPDSFAYQKEITQLAKTRLSQGGAPIRIRIVKGANMEMEKCIASMNDWTQAPYSTKLDTDANFKRMVSYAFWNDNLKAVKIGIGTHNIFEIAFAKSLQTIRNLDTKNFEFEMLEGIANHTRRSVQNLLGPVLIYSPIAGEDEFLNAIAYLVRRLMENTDKENFLSHSFNLTTGSPAWNEEKNKFLSSLDHVKNLEFPSPRHKQNRGANKQPLSYTNISIENFLPDSPTNFSLPENQAWLRKEIINDKICEEKVIPLEIAGDKISSERKLMPCPNLSQPEQTMACFLAANPEDINNAIQFASEAEETQWDLDSNFRKNIFEKIAIEIESHRATLISSAMKTVAKGVSDMDAEISEAIDFVKYYPAAVNYFRERYPNINFEKKGLILVISPWNFPIAIPTGGIIAALATGNRVIIKPSPYSLLATWEVVNLFWKSGVPASALQFIPCEDADASLLTQNSKIDQVIFTGSASTADKILSKRPELDFSGETSGKNFYIVTDSADKELAIKQLVESAFGYNGQKCSATSIAILTHEVYADPKFKRKLKDAVESLPVGNLSEPQHKITPLITNPKKELLQALTQLEPKEQWLVKPQNTGNLWSPAVKWNVQSGSFTHLTEFFGPVLGVMKAKDLEHACALANQTEYGLTAGLQSLDEREMQYFLETVQAGNLYVNNKTTGAIVGRQPFGGIKNSRRGPGGKAGGINYILQLTKFQDKGDPALISGDFSPSPLKPLITLWGKTDWTKEQLYSKFSNEIQRTLTGIKSCWNQHSKYFSKEQNLLPSQQVLGQENIFRYRKVGNFTIRVHAADLLSDILLRLMAGVIAGNEVSVSIPENMKNTEVSEFLASRFFKPIQTLFSTCFETDEALQTKIIEKKINRLACTSQIPESIFKVAIQSNLPLFRQKPVMEGRLLMLEQFNEQSICHTYHRYGNPGLKHFNTVGVATS